jgi:hypothetical protein
MASPLIPLHLTPQEMTTLLTAMVEHEAKLAADLDNMTAQGMERAVRDATMAEWQRTHELIGRLKEGLAGSS